jgi:hypothetical protein
MPIALRRRINERLEKHAASKLGRLAMVILEKPAQTLAAGDDTNLLADLRPRLQDLAIKSLAALNFAAQVR